MVEAFYNHDSSLYNLPEPIPVYNNYISFMMSVVYLGIFSHCFYPDDQIENILE